MEEPDDFNSVLVDPQSKTDIDYKVHFPVRFKLTQFQVNKHALIKIANETCVAKEN